ncbi:hypothetical protein VSQ48_17920 [Candidatus Ventrimonas sp. KK005]|nr:hypothetical protein [Eubacterium sp.]
MKNKREIIGLFLICALMVSLGLAFNPEEDQRYLPFLVVMAFVTLMFFLVKIGQSDLKRHHKTLFFFFASLAEMLWLGWVGITLNGWFTLGFMGVVCVTWFLVNLVYVYLHQRRVVSRWNIAYTAWKSGGSAENYLKEMEQCEIEIKNDTGIMLVYGGIPLNDYISVHKIYLLKEMERNQECLALLKNIMPKIKNPEVQKALSEIETEITKRL